MDPHRDPALTRFRIQVAYDGGRFHGWQVQPREMTVQGELERALSTLTGARPRIQGAGRTDAGVHALGQVADFEVETRIPPHRMAKALNAHLPPDIRVLACEEAPPGFSARFRASWRAYEYVLARARSPFLHRYAYTPPAWPELERMQRSTATLLGEHDFRSFTSQPEGPYGCHLHDAAWTPWRGGLRFRIRADRFLYRMVRVLVGTFLQIGTGKREAGSLPQVLAARDRSAAGPLAPAQGLYLVAVGYDPGWPGRTGPRAVGPAEVGAWEIDDADDSRTRRAPDCGQTRPGRSAEDSRSENDSGYGET